MATDPVVWDDPTKTWDDVSFTWDDQGAYEGGTIAYPPEDDATRIPSRKKHRDLHWN